MIPLAGRSPRSSLASVALAFKRDEGAAHHHHHQRAATASPAPLALVTEEEAVEAGDRGQASQGPQDQDKQQRCHHGHEHHHHGHLDYHHHISAADMWKRENIGLYTVRGLNVCRCVYVLDQPRRPRTRSKLIDFYVNFDAHKHEIAIRHHSTTPPWG